jgi:hypothetical protein
MAWQGSMCTRLLGMSIEQLACQNYCRPLVVQQRFNNFHSPTKGPRLVCTLCPIGHPGHRCIVCRASLQPCPLVYIVGPCAVAVQTCYLVCAEQSQEWVCHVMASSTRTCKKHHTSGDARGWQYLAPLPCFPMRQAHRPHPMGMYMAVYYWLAVTCVEQRIGNASVPVRHCTGSCSRVNPILTLSDVYKVGNSRLANMSSE